MQQIQVPENNAAMALICLLIPLLPFIGFVINGLGNGKLPKSLVSLVGCGSVLVSFLLSIYLFISFPSGSAGYTTEVFNWIKVGSLSIPFAFQIDQLSLIMLLLVTGVGFIIHVYSAGYMSHDEGFGKFFAFLNLFIFSMLLLVMGANYAMMFIGWEGVGLCSYLLIGFWNKVTPYNNAAKKAFIMNRIGDLGFLLGIFLIFITYGSLGYAEVFSKAATVPVSSEMITAITLLLFVGAMGKSAQLPLYTWLPDAMAGPTPVSALIHAATMVTAGIYMVLRSNILYTMAPITLEVVAIIGLATAVFAATIGLFQNDIKKVLAYSTVSQLGYMFLALGRDGLQHVVLPRINPRILQSTFVPWRRFGYSRHERRTGYAYDGWFAQSIADHVHYHADRYAGHFGYSAVCRFLLERRNPGARIRAQQDHVGLRFAGFVHDFLLHVPLDVPDLLRKFPRHGRTTPSPARIAGKHDHSIDHPGYSFYHWWFHGLAAGFLRKSQPGQFPGATFQ